MPYRTVQELKMHIADLEARGAEPQKVTCWGQADGAILFMYKDGKVAFPLDDFDNYEVHKNEHKRRAPQEKDRP